LAFAGFFALYSQSPLIYDNDSYYHLAVARGQADQGLRYEPPIRFGLLGRNFGDKELLFHLALMPLASMEDPLLGGRIALALFGALIVVTIGLLSYRAVGTWGFLIPFWLVFSSAQFTWRLVRLRPELLALLIFLAALWAVARKKYWVLAACGLLFALSYVALHAFLGLCLVLFFILWWVERQAEWQLALAPLIGLGVGILIHPHFPNNLKIWWFVAYDFFLQKEVLDVGTEIGAITTSVALVVNCGWFLGLWFLWRTAQETTESQPNPQEDRRFAAVLGTAALLFGGLTLLMSRFAIYSIPFSTLWLLFELRRRGQGIGNRVSLPFHGSMPTWGALIITLLVSIPVATIEIERWRFRTSAGPEQVVRAERVRAAAALPPGAKTLASWRSTAIFMLWAPQAQFVNVLDPGLLSKVDPEVHQAQRKIFAGQEPDTPLASQTATDSEYLAYYLSPGNARLTARLQADPRAEYLHREISAVVRFEADSQKAFVLDWDVPSSPSGEPSRPYPRLAGQPGALEGYVDGRRFDSSQDCIDFEHRFEVETERVMGFEFAPYGPSSLWLDNRLLAQIHTDLGAILGQGMFIAPTVTPGEHLLKVSTCRARSLVDHLGFYLVRRRLPEAPSSYPVP
jgi:hypothetical protein